MKEQILETLKELGFELKEYGEQGFHFKYEGNNYLYIYHADDEDFLNIVMPGIFELDDDDELPFFKVTDNLNYNLKYVKVYRVEDEMWLVYERELIGGEDLKKLLTHIIAQLDAGYAFLQRMIRMANNEDD